MDWNLLWSVSWEKSNTGLILAMTTQKLWTRWFFHSQLHQRQNRSSRGRRSVSKKPFAAPLKAYFVLHWEGLAPLVCSPSLSRECYLGSLEDMSHSHLAYRKKWLKNKSWSLFFPPTKAKSICPSFSSLLLLFFCFVSQTQSLQRMHFNQLSYRQRSMRENQRRYHLSFYKNNMKQYMN